MNSWSYLESKSFERRNEICAEYFKDLNCILEIGSTDRKLRQYLGEKFKGRVITCDPLLPETIFHSNSDIQFSGKVSELRDYLREKNIEVDGLIALGFNLVQLDQDPFEQYEDFMNAVSLAGKVQLYAIEYPLRFFPAKVESEMLLSLTLPKLIHEEIHSYEAQDVPEHAQLRRMIIGSPTTLPSLSDIETTFIKFRVNSFSPDAEPKVWKRKKPAKPIIFGNTIHFLKLQLVFVYGKPWSYVLNFGNVHQELVSLKFFGVSKGLNICAATEDSQTINFEKQVRSMGRINLLAFSLPNETTLLRFGPKGGIKFFFYRLSGPS